jgi:hypothetical protein
VAVIELEGGKGRPNALRRLPIQSIRMSGFSNELCDRFRAALRLEAVAESLWQH